MSILDLYGDRISVDNKSGCWIWERGVSSEGYGRARYQGKVTYMHRLSYTLSKGIIPDNLLVRHKCHNTRCCNPDHLLIGSDLDNWHDSKEKHIVDLKSRASKWEIDGIVYSSMFNARDKTGLPYKTLIKYTIDGVFDVKAYRAGCKKIGVNPKL